MFKYILIVAFLSLAACAMDDDSHAKVMADVRENDGKGNFHYGYDISNGMGADEVGNENGAKGEYHFISKEGTPVKVTYTADANGFHPSGDVLPTPHPIPVAILKSLEYIRTHKTKDQETKNKTK